MRLLASLVLAASSAGGQDPPDLPEYDLKAGFLYNFAKYVEWPAGAFEKPESPIVLGIVGRDPFGARIDGALKDKAVRGRRFEIRRFPDAAALEPCHMIFAAASEKDRLPEILARAGRWPALTVGESEGFPEAGGMVGILVENRKPRLRVNPDAAERAGLVIDSKLLRVSTIVREDAR